MERRFNKLQKKKIFFFGVGGWGGGWQGGNDYPMNNSQKHSSKFCQMFIFLMTFIAKAFIVKVFLPNRLLLKDRYLTRP